MALPLGWMPAFLIVGITVIAVMLPTGPGFIGAFQWSIIWGLSMFGVSKDVALAYSLVAHAVTAVGTSSFGLWSLLTAHLSMSALVSESQEEVGEVASARSSG